MVGGLFPEALGQGAPFGNIDSTIPGRDNRLVAGQVK